VEIIQVPVEGWQLYRELRLRALKEDPEAFSSSYADGLNQPEELWRKRLTDAAVGEHSWLLFARQDDKLVGMIGAFLEDPSTDTATVVSVYVPKEARRQGISARLMQEMLRLLSRAPGLRKAKLAVNETQLGAIQLYRRFGFVETGVEPATTGAGQAVQQLMMERELPGEQPVSNRS